MSILRIFPDPTSCENEVHYDIRNDADIESALKGFKFGLHPAAKVTIDDIEIQGSHVGDRWYFNPDKVLDLFGNPKIVFNADGSTRV